MPQHKPTKTQKEKILHKLQSEGRITQTTADKMGVLSLSSRINELRKDGYPINTEPFTRNGVTTVRYRLAA